jgi:hypothetical protein
MQAGDIGFARTKGVMGALIRLGEWLKLRKSTYNHQFVIDQDAPGGDWYIIQATLRGVTNHGLLSTVAPGGKYVTMAPPSKVDRDKLLKFARAQVGLRYGYWTILAIAIDTVSWQWFPAFRGARKSSWICSALVCEALRYGGWLHDWLDVYTITPQQAFDVLTSE